MKKFFYLFPLLASMLLAGCSQDDVLSGEDNPEGTSNTSYMAVNLLSSDIINSRAAEGYEDGSEDENNVGKVRFYFFDESGAATNVKLNGTTYVNYYDWEPVDGDQNADSNNGDDVESKLNATIVISTKAGDKLPQKIAAVLNPTSDLGDVSKSLDNLKDVVEDYASAGLTTKGNFVMFNSVYGVGNAEFCAVPIEPKNLCKTEEDAKKNAVIMYVERSVAKVSVSLTGAAAGNNGMLALKDKDDKELKIEGQQVYLKVNGWGLTSETNNGRLVKKINPAWTMDWWNGTHRSFWAINSTSAKNQYHDFNSITTAAGASLYTNENAENDATKTDLNRTKVIIGGTLCKADGTPLTLVRHLGAHFADTYSKTESENLPLLKASILSQLKANGCNYYYYTDEANKTGRKQIGSDDLQIVVASQEATENSDNNCFVYAQLTDAAKAKTWYNSTDENAEPLTDAATTINGKLKDKAVVDWALVWNSGMTYYYFEIIHNLASENAPKGVVRNHVYKANVTKIAGLGTPVYDPEEVIYPEKPDPDETYIAAQINILSWRIVNNDYEIKW